MESQESSSLELSQKAKDIIALAPQWSSKDDGTLLKFMEYISDHLCERGEKTNEALDEFDKNVNYTSIALDNANNNLALLQQTQFVENRISEDDDLKYQKIPPKEPEEPKLTYDEIMEKVLENCFEALNKYYDKHHMKKENGEDDPDNYIFQLKDPYKDKLLPHIYGSKLWNESPHVGLRHEVPKKREDNKGTETPSEAPETEPTPQASEAPEAEDEVEDDDFFSSDWETSADGFNFKDPALLDGFDKSLYSSAIDSLSKNLPKPAIPTSTHNEPTETFPQPEAKEENKRDANFASVISDIVDRAAKAEKPPLPAARKLSIPKQPEKPATKPTQALPTKSLPARAKVNLFDSPPDSPLDDEKPSTSAAARLKMSATAASSQSSKFSTKNIFEDENFADPKSLFSKFNATNLFDDDDDDDDEFMAALMKKTLPHAAGQARTNLFEDSDEDDIFGTKLGKSMETKKPKDKIVQPEKQKQQVQIEKNIQNVLMEVNRQTSGINYDNLSVDSKTSDKPKSQKTEKEQKPLKEEISPKLTKLKVSLFDDEQSEDDELLERKNQVISQPEEVAKPDINETMVKLQNALFDDFEKEEPTFSNFLDKFETMLPSKKSNVKEDLPEQSTVDINEPPKSPNQEQEIQPTLVPQNTNDEFLDDLPEQPIEKIIDEQVKPTVAKKTEESKVHLYSSIFSDEPPEDDEFSPIPTLIRTPTKTTTTEIETTAARKTREESQDQDFYESPVAQKTVKPANEIDYGALHLFSDIPPDDDFLDIEPKPVKNMFDDYSDMPEEKLPEIVSSEVIPAKSIAKLQMPDININVATLLPNAGGMSKIKASLEQRQKIEQQDVKKINSAAKDEEEENTNKLSHMCKGRVRVPANRRPSTRRARHANYQQSLTENITQEQKEDNENLTAKNPSTVILTNESPPTDREIANKSVIQKRAFSNIFLDDDEEAQIDAKEADNKKRDFSNIFLDKDFEAQVDAKEASSKKRDLTNIFLDEDFEVEGGAKEVTSKTRNSSNIFLDDDKEATIDVKEADNKKRDLSKIFLDDDEEAQVDAKEAPIKTRNSSNIFLDDDKEAAIDVEEVASTSVIKKIDFSNIFLEDDNDDDDDDLFFNTKTSNIKPKPILVEKSEISMINPSKSQEHAQNASIQQQRKIHSLFSDEENDTDDDDLFKTTKPSSSSSLLVKPAPIPQKLSNIEKAKKNTSLFDSSDDDDEFFTKSMKSDLPKPTKSNQPNLNKSQKPIKNDFKFAASDDDDDDDLFSSTKTTHAKKNQKPTVSSKKQPSDANNPLADLL